MGCFSVDAHIIQMPMHRKPLDSGSVNAERHGRMNSLQKLTFTFRLDESIVADMKMPHIRPSDIIVKEIRQEIRKRKRLLREKSNSQTVSRFSGEILSTR